MDIDVFEDELDLLAWVKEYTETRQVTEYGAELIKQGLMGGPSMLAWVCGRGDHKVDPRQVMLLVGGGMAAGAIPTYLIKNHLDEVRRQRSIDRSFGAGVATGFAGPALIKALTQSLGQPQMMQAAPQQPQYPLLMDTPNA